MNAGEYYVDVTYLGDKNHNKITKSSQFNIIKATSSISITGVQNITYGSEIIVNAELINSTLGHYELISNGTIIKYGDGIDEIRFDDLNSSNYTLKLYNLGDENHNSSSISFNFTVDKANANLIVEEINNVTYGENITISANLDVIVEFYKNNEFIRNITINSTSKFLLDAGEYKINVIYLGDENHKMSNISKQFNVIQAQSYVNIIPIDDITYGESVTLNATLEGGNGYYQLFRGDNLFKSNDKLLETFNNLASGVYTLIVFNNGDSNHNKSNASTTFEVKKAIPQISFSSVNSTQKGVVIKVVNDKNHPIFNLEVKYSINGINKTDVTGSDGTFAVYLTGDGEIKAFIENSDSYLKSNASYKYNFTQISDTTGNTASQTSATTQHTTKVSKVASKITAKKATFKAKTKIKKYKITLKANKAIIKAKVTIKIGGKTFRATTNSKGKATFKITKLTKKGKYNAVIKYAGNSKYISSTKKVKITIK